VVVVRSRYSKASNRDHATRFISSHLTMGCCRSSMRGVRTSTFATSRGHYFFSGQQHFHGREHFRSGGRLFSQGSGSREVGEEVEDFCALAMRPNQASRWRFAARRVLKWDRFGNLSPTSHPLMLLSFPVAAASLQERCWQAGDHRN